MTNILFIAYQFAPLNVGGTFRSLFFVKYLQQFGIFPIVLTLDPASFEKVYVNFNVDPELLDEIPKETDMRLVPSENVLQLYESRLKAFFNIYFNNYSGSEASKWEKALMTEVEKVILQYKPKALFV